MFWSCFVSLVLVYCICWVFAISIVYILCFEVVDKSFLFFEGEKIIMRIRKLTLVELSEDDDLNAELVEVLVNKGFMWKDSYSMIGTYEDILDDYYDRYKTSPSYFVLSSPECDDVDGFTFDVIDDKELRKIENSGDDFRIIDVEDAFGLAQ